MHNMQTAAHVMSKQPQSHILRDKQDTEGKKVPFTALLKLQRKINSAYGHDYLMEHRK